MAQRRKFNPKRQRFSTASPHVRGLQSLPAAVLPKAPTAYGKAFIVMEDEQKNTFEYRAGSWLPCADTIAQLRESCQVKELPQKVNRMVRYEIRRPLM